MADDTRSNQELKKLEETILSKVKIMIQESSRPMEQMLARLVEDMQKLLSSKEGKRSTGRSQVNFNTSKSVEAPANEGEKQKLKEEDDDITDPASMKVEADINFAEIETVAFQAENNQLSFNTFCSSKEIFPRDPISNASDALDKIRFESLTAKSELDAQPELFIHIIPNKTNHTMSIIDSGIGITNAGLGNNLGTIKRPGTKEFIEVLATKADVTMIGQHGIGFYSVYSANCGKIVLKIATAEYFRALGIGLYSDYYVVASLINTYDKCKSIIDAVHVFDELPSRNVAMQDDILWNSTIDEYFRLDYLKEGCVMHLLYFGEAVSIARGSSEKLFRILDIYDALEDVFHLLEFTCQYKLENLREKFKHEHASVVQAFTIMTSNSAFRYVDKRKISNEVNSYMAENGTVV